MTDSSDPEYRQCTERLLFWNDVAILSLALSPDGRTLVCGDAAGRVWLFEWM